MKTRIYGVLFATLLVVGCASSGKTHEGASAEAPASDATVSNASPLMVPAASAKHLVLNMTGPAIVTQAKDWPAFQEEWRTTFADHAKLAGITFEVQAGDAHPTNAPGTLLKVYVNDYRMVGIGTRIFFGVMTGNAYIDAKASFADLNDGAAFGDRIYNTSSTAWAGVFAKMTPQQVDSLAAQVFAELSAAAQK
jgi:hypothetical protein